MPDVGGQGKQLRTSNRLPGNEPEMMKSNFVLCVVIGAALVLAGCANQKAAETTTTRPHLNPQAGVAGGGGGSGGGGGPGVMLKSQP
jgi:hypothetical protein